MTCNEWESEYKFLETLTDFGIKLGLDKTRLLLSKLSDPHLRYPSVLIAGTNGKGSAASTLSEILSCAGYKVGLYTSPHLMFLRERISVGNLPIPEENLIGYIRTLRALLKKMPFHLYPTYFEALTVIAFSCFAQENVDVAVVEVGMGGRFDATNVLPSTVEIITPVSLDHTQFLGRTLTQISFEKAGIIKEKSVVVCAMQLPEALEVIQEKSKDKKARLLVYGKDFWGKQTKWDCKEQIFNFKGTRNLKNLRTSLLGAHQVQNISLAVQAAFELKEKGFSIDSKDIRKGVADVSWQGRFHIVRQTPAIVLDGAHNYEGICVLKKALSEIFPKQRFSFLVGIMQDKAWQCMVQEILECAQEVVFTRVDSQRALDPVILRKYAKTVSGNVEISIISDIGQSVEKVRNSRENWCICGSLYLVGAVLPKF